jgi:glycosyltransferase involved in cell wall biosynthesis
MEFYWRGGAERVLDMISSELKARHDIALFTMSFQKADYVTLNNLERHVISVRQSLFGRFTRFFRFRKYTELVKQLKSWSPDVILVNKDFQYVDWIAARTRRPVVLYLHGVLDVLNYQRTGPRRKERRNFVSSYYRKMFDVNAIPNADFSSADFVICVSHSTEQFIREYFHGKTGVVYNAVDHQWFSPTWEDENYALCISRFSPEKNLEFLMRALGDAKYPVVVHGSVGETEDGVRYLELLKARRPNNFEIVMHKDDISMKRLLQRCSVFVHPGKKEGFALIALEAMACGKVVVAHNSGGTPECVGDDGGFLLGDDPMAWREKVDTLMSSEGLRRDLDRKAYERSMSFSWENTAKGVEAILQSVVSR